MAAGEAERAYRAMSNHLEGVKASIIRRLSET
jgi:hypothetical protein